MRSDVVADVIARRHLVWLNDVVMLTGAPCTCITAYRQGGLITVPGVMIGVKRDQQKLGSQW